MIGFEEPRNPIKTIFTDSDKNNLFAAAANLQQQIKAGKITSHINHYDENGKIITNNTRSNSGFQSPRR